jgi:hypothetical protein
MTRPIRLAAALTLLLCAPMAATAQSGQALGRLFFSRAERSEIDARRTAPAPAVNGPSAGQSMPGLPAANGMPAAAEPSPPGMPPGMPPAAPPGTTPGTPDAGAAQAAAPREMLELNGMLRNSSGRSTVWLNGVPQAGSQGNVRIARGNAPSAVVTLPSGRKVRLKTGQRYDADQEKIKEINEP